MKIEIRKEIREYILSHVNETLARLGVSEQVKETKESTDRHNDAMLYGFESPAIRQMPMMFKKVYVDGYMVSVEIKEGDRLEWLAKENDIVVVNLNYRWNSFRGGFNGTEIGRMIFAVKKDLPKKFENWGSIDSRETYVRKIEGLNI